MNELLTSSLTNAFHSANDVDRLCETLSPTLKLSETIDSRLFLKALMGVETNFARNNIPRQEPNYGPGGLYYQRSKDLKELYQVYGGLISMSYGPFQIMYATAVNLGYPRTSSPLDLWSGFISGPYVATYLNAQFKRGAETLEQLAMSYNTGRFNDAKAIQLSQYVRKFVSFYQQLK